MRYLPNFRSSSFDVRPAIYDCDFTKLYSLSDLQNKGFTYGRTGVATYIDDNGIVVYNRHNLCLQSQNFTVSWTGDQATATYPVSGQTAPDGTATVNRFNENTNAGSVHRLSSSNAGMASLRDYVCTFSAYLKQDTNSSPARPTGILQFTAGSVSRIAVAFDIRDGFGTVLEASTLAGTEYTNYGISNAGNGWYRCWVQFQASYLAATNLLQGFFGTSTSAGGVSPGLTNGLLPAYTGAGVSAGFFCWGAQIEVNPGPRDYIPTTTAAVQWPRLSETKGLLLEGSSTNLLNWSQTFSITGAASSNLNWVYRGITTSIGTTSPNNITTAVRFKHDGSTTGSATIGISGPIGTSTNRCFSVWAKQISGTGNAWWSYNNGITQTAFAGMSGSWQRYEFTYTNLNHQILLGICAANDEFEFWGAQLETSGWPSTYNHTANASVARATDACGILSPSSNFINSNYGTLFADYSMNWALATGSSVTATVRLATSGSCGAQYAIANFTVPLILSAPSSLNLNSFTSFFAFNSSLILAGNTSFWIPGQFRKAGLNYISAAVPGSTFYGFISGNQRGGSTTPFAGISNLNRLDLCIRRDPTTIPTTRENCQGGISIKRLKYWNAYINNTDFTKITGVS